MPRFEIEKPTLGADILSDETSLRKNTYRKLDNVDTDREGNISRRAGYTLQVSAGGYHSLYVFEKRNLLMLCHKRDLGYYIPSLDTFVTLDTMPDAYRTSFTEANGNLYFVNPSYTGMLRNGSSTVEPIGVALPNFKPEFAPVTNAGVLEAGTYGLAYSVVNEHGEESGLSSVQSIELTAQGGIQGTLFTTIAGSKYRIYLTTANGEELYQAAEFTANTASFLIADHEMGRMQDTLGLEPAPKGFWVRSFGSRLLIGSTDFVYFTEAFRPHLYNPAHGFVAVSGVVSLLESVGPGVYIGDKRGVFYYEGSDPTNWAVKQVLSERVVFNTGLLVPGELFGGELAQFDEIALWLTTSGFCAGLPGGQVVRLTADRLRLPSYVQGCSAYYVRDGRKKVVTPVNSNVLAGVGVAVDSTVN